MNNFMDLQSLLSKNENVSETVIGALEMTDEFVAISELLKLNHTPLEALRFIVNNIYFAQT